MPTHRSDKLSSESYLPLVTEATTHSVVHDMRSNPDFCLESTKLMAKENPVLARKVAQYILLRSGGDALMEETLNTVVSLTYQLLRDQAIADYTDMAQPLSD